MVGIGIHEMSARFSVNVSSNKTKENFLLRFGGNYFYTLYSESTDFERISGAGILGPQGSVKGSVVFTFPF